LQINLDGRAAGSKFVTMQASDGVTKKKRGTIAGDESSRSFFPLRLGVK
jgi:hypothetical protein